MTLESDAKFEEKLALGFKTYRHDEFGKFLMQAVASLKFAL